MRRRTLLVCASTAAASVLPTGIARATAAVDGETVHLGQSVALSGPMGELGKEYRAGAQLYFEAVNAAGGVAGRKIKLTSLDDGYDIDRAVANTNQLVEAEKVFCVFGQFGTGITRATLLQTVHQGVPVFAPYTGADSLREYGNPYLFHVRASYGQELKLTIDHLITMGVPSIGIVYQDDGFGQAALHGAQSALQKHRVQPAATASMSVAPVVDVSRAVAALGKQQPAAILLCTSGKGAVAFIKRYRETRVPAQFYGMSEISSRELSADLGDVARGIVISQVVPSPWSGLVPVSLEYQRLREKQRNVASGYGSLEGFIAAKVLVEGLKRAGRSLTRERLLASLESIVDHDLGGFRVNYGPGGRSGSRFVELSMLSTNGEFVR